MSTNINDTIWITSRVRMISERKALRNQTMSLLAVTYYSLFTVILSIFDDYYSRPYPALDEINLSSSIVVLVASLVAAGFRLEAKASAFRECYLKLQTLHDKDEPELAKRAKYREIMMDFPNHSPCDYTDLLVTHILIEGKKLENGGKPLTYTWLMLTSFLLRSAVYWSLLAILYLGPLVFLLLPFVWCRGL